MVSAVSGASSSINFASLKQAQPTPQERFSASDADGSGGLSIDEYSSFVPDFVEDVEGSFTQIDADGDGQLTDSELSTFAESEGVGGPQGGPPPPPPPSGSDEEEDDLLSLLDSDDDGEVSTEEFESAAEQINEFLTSLLSAQEEYLAA